jgi:hypothetical protein
LAINDKAEGSFMEVRRVKGDSTLRKEMIDLDSDIIDFGDLLDIASDDEIFKAIMSAKSGLANGKTALEMGLRAIVKEDDGIIVKEELKRRLGIEV